MKSIEDLLRNLARPEVLEFGLVTNRLPSVNIGGKFEPVDDHAPSNERVLQMLAIVGGQRHLDGSTDKPLQWTTRLDGVGTIAVAAIVRQDVVQARFTLLKRDPKEGREVSGSRPSMPAVVSRSSEGAVVTPRMVPTPSPSPIQPQPIQNIGAGVPLVPPGPPPPPPHKGKTAPMGSSVANALAQAAAAQPPRPADLAKTLQDPPQIPLPPEPPPPTPDEVAGWQREDDEVTVQTLSPPVAGHPGFRAERRTSSRPIRVASAGEVGASGPPAPLRPSPAPLPPPPAPVAPPEAPIPIPDSARTQLIPPMSRLVGSAPSGAAAPLPPSGAAAPLPPPGVATPPPSVVVAPPPPPEPPLPKVEITAPVDTFLALAVTARASDLLLVAGRPLLLRVGLELVPRTQPILAEHVERMTKEIVPPRLREVLERDGACDFAIEHPTHGRFRVHVGKQRYGYELALRVIPRELPTLSGLGLPEALVRVIRDPGLVLVTSPSGQGRSTTVAALVDHVNRERAVHVLSLEEPIEHVHVRKRALVTQRDLGLHVRRRSRGFASALREDADVLVVADLRDAEGARLALAAAEGGRLVLATIPAPSTPRAVELLLDLFTGAERSWARGALARSLRAVVGQRLVPSADRARLHPAVEIVPWSAQLSSAVRTGRTDQIADVLAGGKAFGIVRLEDSLAELVRSQKVPLDAARRVAQSPALLERLLAGPPSQSVPPVPPPPRKN